MLYIHYFNAHFSHCVFLLMTYFLLFILYVFWTTEMMLDKSKFQHFFIPVQNGSLSSSDNTRHQHAFDGPRTATKHAVQW